MYVKAYYKPKLTRQKGQPFEDMAATERALPTVKNMPKPAFRTKASLVIQHHLPNFAICVIFVQKNIKAKLV